MKISATSEESNEATEGNWEIFCARKTELSNEERLRQESLHLTWSPTDGWTVNSPRHLPQTLGKSTYINIHKYNHHILTVLYIVCVYICIYSTHGKLHFPNYIMSFHLPFNWQVSFIPFLFFCRPPCGHVPLSACLPRRAHPFPGWQ